MARDGEVRVEGNPLTVTHAYSMHAPTQSLAVECPVYFGMVVLTTYRAQRVYTLALAYDQ